MRSLKKMATTFLCCMTMIGTAVCTPVAADDDQAKKTDNTEGEKTQGDPKKSRQTAAVSQAALAAQLALQGEKRRSPILLLAAAEVLGGLTESEREVAAIQAEGGQGDAEKPSLELTLDALVRRARKLAEEDEELSSWSNRGSSS